MVSEDLADEIEAINSIYGAGTLVVVDAGEAPDDATLADLAVPASAEDVADDDGSLEHRLHLRLWFPAAYPACTESPAVLGVQSVGDVGRATDSGHRRPGAAAHDAAQFGHALTSTFQEGQVCLFDAVEEYLRQQEAQEARAQPDDAPDTPDAPDDAPDDAPETSPDTAQPVAAPSCTRAPPWVTADPVVELKSTFLARCAPVSSPAEAAAFVQHLKDTDRRVRSASHNMTAFRIRADNGVSYQDCDDDGETAAGGRLLHLMQLMDLWNVVVVVTRWYGGHKLGPRRFALINQAARDAFVRAGLVVEKKKK